MWRLKVIITIFLAIAVTLTGTIFLDMVITRSWYHPMIYPYQILSGVSCLLFGCPNQTVSPVESNQGMVVTARSSASEVGQNILAQGGNAIDAAVAVGYALAVVHPCCGNLGGGGFMVIHQKEGDNISLNFREKAPEAVSPHMYQGKSSTEGYSAVAVPGTVKGLEAALTRYGTMTHQEVMEPAITLAQDGFVLQKEDIEQFEAQVEQWREQPTIADIFLRKGQFPYAAGDRLVQPELAATLELIAKEGEQAFYQGAIAQSLVTANETNGGLITAEDLANYTVTVRKPVACQYRGYQVYSAALPGGGITLCEMLNLLSGYNLADAEETERHHWQLATMLYAFADRNAYLGDPEYVEIPVKRLLSLDHATFLRAKISESAISPQPLFPTPSDEGEHTTHYSIVDAEGNAVSVTYTINSLFGAGVMAPETGFFLNNEMDDFTTNLGEPNQFGLVQGRPNRIKPGKRPLSSMSPTIVIKDKQPFLVTGSPGGPTILTTVMQVITNLVDQEMSLAEAVSTLRFHYQGLPNIVVTEPYGFSPTLVEGLWQRGYQVIPFRTWGAAESILVQGEQSQGVNDPRRPAGEAKGN